MGAQGGQWEQRQQARESEAKMGELMEMGFSRAAAEVPLPFPFDETRQGGVPCRADVRESVASTAWRRGRSATMAWRARGVMA